MCWGVVFSTIVRRTPGVKTSDCNRGGSGKKRGVLFLFQELRGPPVREDLALGLARGAVLERRVGKGDLPDRVPAYRTGLACPGMDAHVASLHVLEVLGRLAAGFGQRSAEDVMDGVVQDLHRLPVQGLGRGEGRNPGRMQDLVAVGVAD